MSDLLLIFFGSFIIGLSGAMMPGPMFTVTISHAAKQGVIAGPLVVLGHAILESALVLAVGFGLGKLLLIKSVTAVIGIFGGAILLWMGFGMIRNVKSLTLSFSISQPKNTSRSIIDGIITSLANPYWFIWWASIGLALILKAWDIGMLGLIFFFFGHIASDFAWYTAVSTAVAAGKKIMNDIAYRVMIGICGIILIGFGFYFGFDGLKKIIL
ncbi:MAG: LysE family translocator [bacterium]|nr:LysE family translocator [bacterium]